ncbi:MAG TPA: cobalamin-binding protein [Burkholderiales bacterium]|nr:cobalamin-binding protein [Burkholderiales bacterium]
MYSAGKAAIRRLFFFAGLLSQLFSTNVQPAVEVADDRGLVLRREFPAQRVIALAPHLTELVFAAGAGNRLVARVRGSDFPPEARAVAEVGDAAGLDFERIVALQPDLVLAWGSGNRRVDVQRLERLGLAVAVLEPRRLDDIQRHIRMLGVLLGTERSAQASATAFALRAGRLREQYAGKLEVSVLFQAWHQPLITVNEEHLISDVLRLCGARNAFGGLPQLAAAVSPEQVLAADPDAIIIGTEAQNADANGWLRYRYLKSVRAGAIFTVSADLIARQTPRVLDAADKICADLDSVRDRNHSPPLPGPLPQGERES